MSPTDLPRHPDAADFLNFAKEELGENKKERILGHCRDCPACAELLLAAVREHAPPPQKIPLTRWQKGSIVLLIVLLIGTVEGMVWLLRSIGQRVQPFSEAPPMFQEQEQVPGAVPEGENAEPQAGEPEHDSGQAQ